MIVVITGNPIDGFAVHGPFEDEESAAEWGVRGEHCWWVTTMEAP